MTHIESYFQRSFGRAYCWVFRENPQPGQVSKVVEFEDDGGSLTRTRVANQPLPKDIRGYGWIQGLYMKTRMEIFTFMHKLEFFHQMGEGIPIEQGEQILLGSCPQQ
ncbi:MAG TPA: hypothetical protein VN711_03145 [Candidatus Saccharimonadales bacterium]|nr:hypothetical protein [Candidatus Saccharimonadales bacterium]